MENYVKDPTWKDETSDLYRDDEDTDSTTVRSEIDKTRERLSTHLDQLQERFQPENIKQQTQQAVEGALTDSLDTVKSYVNDYVQEINWNEVRDSILGTVRRNPLPTALIGVGLGWMFLNGSRSQSNSSVYRQRNGADRYTHGLGWREETPEMESPNAMAKRQANTLPRGNAPEASQLQSRSFGDSYASGWGNTSDKGKWQNEDGSVVEQLKEGVVDAASQVRDGARQVTSSLYEQVSNVGSQMQQSASNLAEGASEWVEQWQESGETASQWSQNKAESITNYTQRTLDENPLMFGAVALAVGAGLGMLLPATRYEAEVFGDLREQAIDTVQGVVAEVKDRAKTVIDELQPDIENAAVTAVKNIEGVGKQAVGEVRQSIQKATEKLDSAADSNRQS